MEDKEFKVKITKEKSPSVEVKSVKEGEFLKSGCGILVDNHRLPESGARNGEGLKKIRG